MCQESLINYLDTSLNRKTETVPRSEIETFVHLGEQISHYEAVKTRYAVKMPKSIEQHAREIDTTLSDILICDPAVGSGAFPVGMMAEIVRARCALTSYFNDVHERTPYYFKRHAIQNCLYGVDIDSGAVEIAKLRLWLSLVVDEEETKQIKPLPNLLYKIVAGNSLLGVEKTLFNEKLFRQLENLKPLFFDEVDIAKKARIRQEIDGLIHQLTRGDETFDFHIYFSEAFHRKNGKNGFDVIIANPPYDVLNVTEGQKIERKLLDIIRHMPQYQNALGGKLNLFRLFMAKGMDLLSKDACLTYIVPYGFMCDSSSKTLRKFILSEKQIVFVEAFPERDDPRKRLFEAAKMSTCIVLIRNASSPEKFVVRTHYSRYISKSVPTVHLDYKLIQQIDATNYPIPLMDDSELAIVRKMVAQPHRLRHFGRCYEGEVNQTFHKKFFRSQRNGNAKLIKGAAVQRFLIKDKMSQGEIEFLDEKAFLKSNRAPKTQHHELKRLIMQGMTGVNEKTRLITPSTKLVTLFNWRHIGRGVHKNSSSPPWASPA